MQRVYRHPGEILFDEVEWRWLDIWCGIHGIDTMLSIRGLLDKSQPKSSKLQLQSVAMPDDIETHKSHVWVQYDRLPFADDSIPHVLCPHLLEVPHLGPAALGEAARILQPGGYLVLFGYHMFSPLGVQRLLADDAVSLPSLSRVGQARRLLLDLGLTLVDERMIAYRPMVKDAARFESLLALEIMGVLLWRPFGSVYGIVARKDKMGYIPGEKWAVSSCS